MSNFHAAGAQNDHIVFYNAAVSNTACAEQMSLKSLLFRNLFTVTSSFFIVSFHLLLCFLIRSHIPNISRGFFVAQKACWKGKSLKKQSLQKLTF